MSGIYELLTELVDANPDYEYEGLDMLACDAAILIAEQKRQIRELEERLQMLQNVSSMDAALFAAARKAGI